MVDQPPRKRGRRIHVEGADAAWSQELPPMPQGFRPASPAGPSREGHPGPSLAAAASEETLQRNLAAARSQITNLVTRVSALRGRLDELSAVATESAAHAVLGARDRSAALRRQRSAEMTGQHRAQEEEAVADLLAQSDRILSPLAGVPWSELSAASTAPCSRFLRVGSLHGLDAAPPAIAPFLGHPGWYVTGPRQQVDNLIVGALIRVVAQAPLKKMRLTVFDPRSRGVLGRLAPLRQAVGSAFVTPTADPRVFADRLGEVLEAVSRDTELVAAVTSGDLIDLWRSAPVPDGTLHVIALLDYPYGVDEALQQYLVRIAATESPARPTLLIGADPTQSSVRDIQPEQLRRLLIDVVGSHGTWRLPGYPSEVTIQDDGAPPDAVVTDVLERAAQRAKSDTGPTILLTDLLAKDIASPWTHDSTDSLDLVFGRAGRGDLELSLRTQNPPHPNMLVGGAVGTGKSNLLLDIIFGLALRYSPEEFELHLLDFKQGLEFARFAPDAGGQNWLPHVRTLSLESDRAFGVAVLRWLVGELEARAERFKATGHSGIVGHRRATGERVPRLLLVVDEFHELFSGSEAETEAAVDALERLAKQGRVYGVHLLLASQTTSGVSALAVRGQGIFAQFPLRLSLKNTVAESEAILSQGNKAAADLTYRGEVVFNTNAGHAPETSNQVGIAAYAELEATARLQQQLWLRGHGRPPLVFLGTEYAAWPRTAPTRPATGLELWLGRPIAVDDSPRVHWMAEDSDQAVVVVGQARPGNVRPRDILRSIVVSALPGLRGGQVVFLDGDGEESDQWFADIERRLRHAGVDFRRLGNSEAAGWLRSDLADRLEERVSTPPLLVVAVSAQRLRDLDVDEASDANDFSIEPRTARTVLRDLATRGAMSGAYFLGSWSNVRTLEADLGTYSSGVAAYLTVDLGLDDLRSIVGPAVQRVEGSPRIGLFDRAAGDTLEVLVPYSPHGEPEEPLS